MRLTSLHIEQLPGIDGPVGIADLTPGVNVIVGPNASGKSSLLRALLALLYPSEHEGVVAAQARFLTASGAELTARRLGRDVVWERGGRPTRAPAVPAYHLVGAYTLRLEDLVTTADAPPVKRGPGRPAADRANGGLAAGTQLDRFIADRIVRQLTGGIDMEQVRRALGGQAEAGRKLAGTVRSEAKEVKRLEQRRAALVEREAQLPALRAEREAAREMARLSSSVADALLLVTARAEAHEIGMELATYPPDLDKLRGDEDEALAKLTEAARGEAAKLAACEAELAELRRSVVGAAVRDDLTAAEVGLQLERADSLLEDEARLAAKASERQALTTQLTEVGKRLGAASGAVARLADIEVSDLTMQRVEELLQQRQSARAAEDALLQLMSRSRAAAQSQPSEALGSDDQLARLRANLLRWLAAPSVEPRRPAWTWGLALSLTTAVVVAASLGAPGAVLLSLAGATGLWLLSAWLVVRPVKSGVRDQVEAETLQARAQPGVALPAVWEHAEVADVVAALDAELAERARLSEAERRRLEAEKALTADLESVRDRLQQAQQQLDALRARFGFAVGPDVSLAAWLHAVRDLTRLQTALAGVQVEGSTLDRRVKQGRAELLSFLAGAGRETAATSFTADNIISQRSDELRAALRTLARVVDQRDADRLKLASLTRDSDRCRQEVQRLTAERQRLLGAAGLPDVAAAHDELLHRLAVLPAWREAAQRKRASEARVAAHEQRLAGSEGLNAMIESGDVVGLEEAAAACRAAQARSEELGAAIAQIQRDIELAASDTSITQTAARFEAAVEELSAHRDEAVQLASADFLLAAIESEHRSEAQPPALARAAALFERFTRGEFFLRFESESGTRRRLAAADLSGRLLGLDQLSTGTRAQLLIASRLAFALDAEGAAGAAPSGGAGDVPDTERSRLGLPFFLDEALTTSDQQRFAAVASAILDVAALEGRQFIYLSARSDDADLWQSAAAAHGSTIGVVQLGSQGAGRAASPAAS